LSVSVSIIELGKEKQTNGRRGTVLTKEEQQVVVRKVQEHIHRSTLIFSALGNVEFNLPSKLIYWIVLSAVSELFMRGDIMLRKKD
jgi:hypothetical protein